MVFRVNVWFYQYNDSNEVQQVEIFSYLSLYIYVFRGNLLLLC